MTNVTCSAAAHAGNHHGDAVEGYGIEQMFEGTTERGVVDTDVIGVVDKVGYVAGIRVYGRVVVVHKCGPPVSVLWSMEPWVPQHPRFPHGIMEQGVCACQ